MAQSNYHITLTNDGNGGYSALLRRGGTAASGGTAINSTVGSNMDLTKVWPQIAIPAQIALQLALDDRAAGN